MHYCYTSHIWRQKYMSKTSEAQKRANKKYNDKATKTLTIRTQNESLCNKDNIEKWAKSAGMSVNKYVITAIIEKAQRDGMINNIQ